MQSEPNKQPIMIFGTADVSYALSFSENNSPMAEKYNLLQTALHEATIYTGKKKQGIQFEKLLKNFLKTYDPDMIFKNGDPEQVQIILNTLGLQIKFREVVVRKKWGDFEFDEQMYSKFIKMYNDTVKENKCSYDLDELFNPIVSLVYSTYLHCLKEHDNSNGVDPSQLDKVKKPFLDTLRVMQQFQEISESEITRSYYSLFFLALYYSIHWCEIDKAAINNYYHSGLKKQIASIMAVVQKQPEPLFTLTQTVCSILTFNYSILNTGNQQVSIIKQKKFGKNLNTLTRNLTQKDVKIIKDAECNDAASDFKNNKQHIQYMMMKLIKSYNKYNLSNAYQAVHLLPERVSPNDYHLMGFIQLFINVLTTNKNLITNEVEKALGLFSEFQPTLKNVETDNFNHYYEIKTIQFETTENGFFLEKYRTRVRNAKTPNLDNLTSQKIILSEQIQQLEKIKKQHQKSLEIREKLYHVYMDEMEQKELAQIERIEKKLQGKINTQIHKINQADKDKSQPAQESYPPGSKNSDNPIIVSNPRKFSYLMKLFHKIRTNSVNTEIKISSYNDIIEDFNFFIPTLNQDELWIELLSHSLIADIRHIIASAIVLQAKSVNSRNHWGQRLEHLTKAVKYYSDAVYINVKRCEELLENTKLQPQDHYASKQESLEVLSYIKKQIHDMSDIYKSFTQEIEELNILLENGRIEMQKKLGDKWFKPKPEKSYLAKLLVDTNEAKKIIESNENPQSEKTTFGKFFPDPINNNNNVNTGNPQDCQSTQNSPEARC